MALDRFKSQSSMHASIVHGSRKKGAALVLILAFLVLLTGLVIAFFSRAMTERQVSNASVSQSKADLLARSAAEVIVGDLKQEIVAGSVSPAATPAPGVTLYTPTSAGYMLPQTSGTPTPTPYPSGSPNPNVVNLVRRSVRNDPLAAPVSSPIRAVSTAASAVNSTSNLSLNGRYVTLARWNSHYLLPRHIPPSGASTIDSTPISPLNTTGPESYGFTPPDWVMVTSEKGPVVLSSPSKDANNNTVTPIGRYAYAIYDEGGLLDVNVAGYPSNSTSTQTAYKSSEAYAELKLLMTLAGTSTTQVDNIVGWRNYVTTQATGSLSGSYSFGNPSLYYNYLANNTTGFLSANPQPSPSPVTSASRTDQRFTSRQDFLKFRRATTMSQDALQYLTTFSRDLNQPSFVRVQSVDSTAPGYDAAAPKILAANAGGNNATGLDSAINPSFLAVRVKTTTAGARSDGSDLTVGEPLVKKRFNLTRLAWLTYAGPIANAAGTALNPTGDPGVSAMITSLENTYGLADAFLKQGTASNIQKYFGLNWDATNHVWLYNLHNRDGATGAIRKLSYSGDSGKDVLGANREADFFELLKASINVGSIAKPGTVDSTVVNTAAYLHPPVADQYQKDRDVDGAIMQIGANIIDQFDADGYVTRINFDNGSGPREFRGVENLPCLSRILNGTLRIVAPNSPPLWPYNNGGTVGAGSVTNTGLGALIQTPELWNPHNWDASNAAALDKTLGVAGPTKFRIYAKADPLVVSTNPDCSNADTTSSPGYPTPPYNFNWGGEQVTLSETTTEIDFDVPKNATGAQLFREPTFLFRPGKPTGSNLASPPFQDPSKLGRIGNDPSRFTGGGITAADAGENHPRLNTPYIGIYLGAFPLVWKNSSGSSVFRADIARLFAPAIVKYYLQYRDAGNNWVTYDEKAIEWADPLIGGGTMAKPMREQNKGFLTSRWQDDRYAMVLDPRTSRFNFIQTACYSTQHYDAPPFNGSVTWDNGWIPSTVSDGNVGAKDEGLVITLRNGRNLGVAIQADLFFQNSMGFYPGNWAWNDGRFALRPGLFSQNVNISTLGNQPLGDGEGYSNTGPVGQMITPQCYADADGVVRRAMGAYVTYPWTNWTVPPTDPKEVLGLPMRTAHTYDKTVDPATGNPKGLTKKVENSFTLTDSRPVILNRPFRSVAELGYTFSGTPWKNVTFSTPESGDSGLLDVFCINDTDDVNALIAGKVNLNTRQRPVLTAILAGAYRDELGAASPSVVDSTFAGSVADKLLARTGASPLANVAELVGKWKTGSAKTVNGTAAYDGSVAYDGFSADLQSVTGTNAEDTNIHRFRDASMRALANCGQTRVWNLMIDVVAQTGRYPSSAANAANPLAAFVVEGEQRYWVHVAIDRYTGQVIDKQIEVVKE
jgi:hypothetical protein